jgi:hypothetical protein
MRAVLVRDALYRSIRNKYIDIAYRKEADVIFRNILIADGTNFIRAWYFYECARLFGKSYAMELAEFTVYSFDGEMAKCVNERVSNDRCSCHLIAPCIYCITQKNKNK